MSEIIVNSYFLPWLQMRHAKSTAEREFSNVESLLKQLKGENDAPLKSLDDEQALVKSLEKLLSKDLKYLLSNKTTHQRECRYKEKTIYNWVNSLSKYLDFLGKEFYKIRVFRNKLNRANRLEQARFILRLYDPHVQHQYDLIREELDTKLNQVLKRVLYHKNRDLTLHPKEVRSIVAPLLEMCLRFMVCPLARIKMNPKNFHWSDDNHLFWHVYIANNDARIKEKREFKLPVPSALIPLFREVERLKLDLSNTKVKIFARKYLVDSVYDLLGFPDHYLDRSKELWLVNRQRGSRINAEQLVRDAVLIGVGQGRESEYKTGIAWVRKVNKARALVRDLFGAEAPVRRTHPVFEHLNPTETVQWQKIDETRLKELAPDVLRRGNRVRRPPNNGKFPTQ